MTLPARRINPPVLFICLLFLNTLISGCGDKIEPGTTRESSRGITARIAEATLHPRPLIYEAMGTVAAQESTTLSGKIMGVVKAIRVREGDTVTAGQELIVLDQRQVAAGLQGSQAQLEEAQKAYAAAKSARDAARAGAELAQATFDRYLKLYREESATRQEFEEVEARHRQASAALAQAEAMTAAANSRVTQAKAAVAGARVTKKDAVITAPYDGIVSAKFINEGDLASPGTPLLTIEKTGGFQAELMIPEQYIRSVAQGQELTVNIPDQKDLPALKGKVTTIAPSADARTRSFLIKVELPAQGLLRSGMFARINIPIGTDNLLIIPESAVVQQGQLTGYFKVDDKHIARFRLLRMGKVMENGVEVISGLKPGTTFVVSPPEELSDGMTVREAP